VRTISCILTFLLSILTIASLHGQTLTQTIRGRVVDADTRAPLIGATIVVLDTDPVIGTVTDPNGTFHLSDIPVRRQGIKVSYIGYEEKVFNNLMVVSGKELVLNVELEEKIQEVDEVVIKAWSRKDQPINDMASVSARSFTIEETERFAGSLGDPARLVANYAGVVYAGDSRNDIVIRGNSPMGLLWRLDGVEIPNPNHFAALGTTGGAISMINNNLLTNSDFFTGAFPAEYGNATAGVFDLKLRSGNNENREYVFQVGLNGFELGAEGPFSKNAKASYLINYRYSTYALLHAIGIETGEGSSTPFYQDLSFKLDFPGTKIGRITLFGIGGLSSITLNDSEKDSTEFSYGLSGTDTDFGSDMGTAGLTHLYFINEKSRIKTSLSIQGLRAYTIIDSIARQNHDSIYPYYRSRHDEMKYSLSSQFKTKFNPKNTLSVGIVFDIYRVSFLDSLLDPDIQRFETFTDTEGTLSLARIYTQWQHKFSDNLVLNSGLHFQYSPFNGTNALEPRLGLKWGFAKNQTLSLGFGLHSQLQPHIVYFYQAELPDGNHVKNNEDLGFTKSLHTVLGYDYLIGTNLRLKLEAYYQYLYNIPVTNVTDFEGHEMFSMINAGDYFAVPSVDSMINEGTGRNYGLELTLEKFLDKGYYFLLTTSLYDSKYEAVDGVVRNTSFNGNYVVNALGGKEFNVGKNSMITLDLKSILAGGKRYIPILEAESLAQKEAVYDWDKAYEQKHNPYFRIDFRIGFKRNGKRMNEEYALDLQNITNHKNIFLQTWDADNGTIRTDYQTGFYPMMLYRVNF